MRLPRLHCPRFSVHEEAIDARLDSDCAACAPMSARVPGPAPKFACRWQGTLGGRLQCIGVCVSAEPANERDHSKISSADIWLKIAVHLAGFASLSSVPLVGALLAHLGEQLKILW
jgi:hypothetical protein